MKIEGHHNFRKAVRSYFYHSLTRHGLPTIGHLFDAPVHSNQYDLQLLTFTIFPELARVWSLFAENVVRTFAAHGLKARIVVVDSSLSPSFHPTTSCQHLGFINLPHYYKIDIFIRLVVKSPVIMLCDDDCIMLDPAYLYKQYCDLTSSNAAAISLYPRDHWWFHVQNQNIPPMGTHCLLFKRAKLLQHRLWFTPTRNEYNHDSRGTYDTGDEMNRYFLDHDIPVIVITNAAQKGKIAVFRGSSAWVPIAGDHTRDELLEYFFSPRSYDQHFPYYVTSFYSAAKILDIHNRVFNVRATPKLMVDDIVEIRDTCKDSNLRGILTAEILKCDKAYGYVNTILHQT